jgi:hypothetical protein
MQVNGHRQAPVALLSWEVSMVPLLLRHGRDSVMVWTLRRTENFLTFPVIEPQSLSLPVRGPITTETKNNYFRDF